MGFSRPYGTWMFRWVFANPALRGWAILGVSLRDELRSGVSGFDGRSAFGADSGGVPGEVVVAVRAVAGFGSSAVNIHPDTFDCPGRPNAPGLSGLRQPRRERYLANSMAMHEMKQLAGSGVGWAKAT